jgi:hypothetical protein
MSSNKKKISLDDIFQDDDFGLLESTAKTSNVKSEDDRLVDSFEEINGFVDKNGREPNTSSMSEYGLLARLKNIRQNEQQKVILKPFDRHNLLGEVEILKTNIDDILSDDDFGLLETDSDLSIFKYKHISKEDERAEADFVAQRKPLKESEFKPYEAMFQKVHREIKEGKRKVLPFRNTEKNLHVGDFYLIDGVMLYLKEANLEKTFWETSGGRERIEGRTFTIFENGTYSNMLFRSLGKQIQKNGKLITNTYEEINAELYVNSGMVKEEDIKPSFYNISYLMAFYDADTDLRGSKANNCNVSIKQRGNDSGIVSIGADLQFVGIIMPMRDGDYARVPEWCYLPTVKPVETETATI